MKMGLATLASSGELWKGWRSEYSMMSMIKRLALVGGCDTEIPQ